ncbi:hypothetical protein FGO68_gene13685 [Halteria grandinella]|uniref:Uncharacterized protein n=1 Tax=Halteria grandinella TaxID=5974 RepID=A0A8J8NAH3_HALGN|nr:hypothetical protein FGO68_gene13685 [Halteria grandinella]
MQSVAKLHTGKTLVVHNRFQAMLIFIEQLLDYHFGQSCSILRAKESQGFSQIDMHGEDGRVKATIKIVQMLHHMIVYFTQIDAVKGTENTQRIQLDLTKQVSLMKSDSGSFYAQSPSRPFLPSLFGLRQASLLYHTLTLRLTTSENHFASPKLDHLPANLIIYHLTVFLDCAHIARKLLCLNTRMASLERGMGVSLFWHRVYMARPGSRNPGFQVDKVDWRKLLVKKEKEARDLRQQALPQSWQPMPASSSGQRTLPPANTGWQPMPAASTGWRRI